MKRLGAAHIVAKPRIYLRNGPNPEGPEDGDDEEGGAATGRERGGEGGEGKGMERETPPPPPAEAVASTGRAIRAVRREQKHPAKLA